MARGLENEWEKRLRDLTAAEAELERRQQQRPRTLSREERARVRALGSDLRKVWTAPTTTDRDRKELLRTLLEDVIVAVDRPRGTGPARVSAHAGSNHETRRLAPNGIAACKARRSRSHARDQRAT